MKANERITINNKKKKEESTQSIEQRKSITFNRYIYIYITDTMLFTSIFKLSDYIF